MAVYESKAAGSRPRHPPSLIAATTMVLAAIVLINADRCQAAVLLKSNDTYRCMTGGECLIAEDMELESLMEFSTHVTRVLATGGGTGTGKTPDPNVAACKPIGPGGKYNCNPKASRNHKNCGSKFNRNCPT